MYVSPAFLEKHQVLVEVLVKNADSVRPQRWHFWTIADQWVANVADQAKSSAATNIALVTPKVLNKTIV